MACPEYQSSFLKTSGQTLRRSSARMEAMHLILLGIFVWYSVADDVDNDTLVRPHLSGPSIALEGSIEEFYCHMSTPANMSFLLKLYVNLDKVIGEHIVNFGEVAFFPTVLTKAHDGQLICEASGNNHTEIENIFSNSLDLRVIRESPPVKGAAITSHLPTEDLWEGETLILQCNVTKGSYVSYDWLRNGMPVQTGYDTSSLIIRSLSVQHTGDYMCVASNRFNYTLFNSSSDVMSVQVKEYMSRPEISLNIIKIGAGNFNVIVKCRSEKGTPLKTFSLLNDTKVIAMETTDRSEAFFNVSIELNQDMGWVRCNASNQGNWVLSEPKSLTVESVGGAVKMTPLKHIGRDFQVVGLVLRCQVERGTFPHYHWFLNDSRLEGKKQFYALGWNDDSILSLSLGPDSSGFYHCEASDRFDNSTRVRSRKMLISNEVLNKLSALVVIVVFSCFFLLILAVTVCCIYGAVLRRRYSRKYLLSEQHGEIGVTSKEEDEDEDDKDEDYLTVVGYEEDVVNADRTSDSHSEEEQSVDETVLYEGAVSK